MLVMVFVAGAVCSAETPQWPENPPDNWVTYHLAHPGPGKAVPGDPNPAFYYKGRYHMHYIYNNGKRPVFGHVSSKDMVHWKWHPTVLKPSTTGHGMYSGTGLFTRKGKPFMIYHGQGSGRNWLAYGLDDNLDKWSKPEAVIAKTEDGKPAEIRYWDPDCWLNGDTYYAISGGRDPELMKSDDLKNWKYLGKLLHDDYSADLGVTRNEDISCANMFRIGNKWMLLCISHTLGCRYYLGDFKDEKYLPDFHARMNWQKTIANNLGFFFAPESLLTKDGRRVMWTWLRNGGLSSDGVQSLPRELELPEDGILRMKPLRELASLRYDEKSEKNITVKKDDTYILKQMAGDTLELKVEFKTPKAKEFGVDVFCDENGENGLRIVVVAENKKLRIGTVNAPFELKQGEDMTLRVFIDKNLVEIFANDRQAVAFAHKRSHALANIRLFSIGSDLKVKKVTAWKMKSIYQVSTEKLKGVDLTKIPSPQILPGNENTYYRDPTAIYHDGVFRLFFTVAQLRDNKKYMVSFLGTTTSQDLVSWTPVKLLTPEDPALNYSSPGNIIRYKGEWIICFQSYPIPSLKGFFGDRTARLFIMRSKDLENWSEPELLKVKGPDVPRGRMGRMIDPYLIEDKDEPGKWWCFYKQNGASMSYSYDLKTWKYFGRANAGENVCVLRLKDHYYMFHSPGLDGMGLMRSRDMKNWEPVVKENIKLGYKVWPWARIRLTAGFVLDLKEDPRLGKYLMFYNGIESHGPDGICSLGIAWSDDLINWSWPKKP